MIDIFTRRRLLLLLLAISFVIISILFFSRLMPVYSQSTSFKIDDTQDINECYLTELVDVLTLCQKCTPYERRSKSKACSLTGYKELVLCSKSNIKTIRSCPIPTRIQRQSFWLFEIFMFILALIAIFNVNFRQKTLDKQMIERIKKQIGENDE